MLSVSMFVTYKLGILTIHARK